MSLRHQAKPGIPTETQAVAEAAFPKGNVYMAIHDELDGIYEDADFVDLYSAEGQPGVAAWRLAVVTVLQFMESLSDEQAAQAVRGRIDWKYLLELELTDAGFDATVLGKFRQRLWQSGAEERLLEGLLHHFEAQGILKQRGRQRTDSTHVLSAVRELSRYECVGEAIRAALNDLSEVAPDWVLAQTDATWVKRYGHRVEGGRMGQNQVERQAWAEQVAQDGHSLLQAVYAPPSPAHLRQVASVEILRQIWGQQFYTDDTHSHWRTTPDLPPCALLIVSPYAVTAHFGKKRETAWLGYKVHLTETCDPDQPRLVVNVLTTPATTEDVQTLEPIHAHLATTERLPSDPLVDTGYLSAENLGHSQTAYNVNLVGPVLPDTSWQARADQGFAQKDFTIDWHAQAVTCPQGQTTTAWREHLNEQAQPRITITFPKSGCQSCATRLACTHHDQRTLKLYPQSHYEALLTARQHQLDPAFKALYNLRAGVEGTVAQVVQALDARQSRYLGITKTHLQHLILATALNLWRWADWFFDQTPSQTRLSSFAALYAPS